MTVVDIDRWPDVAAPPFSRLRAALAAGLVRRTVRRMPILVALPDGRVLGSAHRAPVLRLHRPKSFFRRLGVGGLIGFGEAYQAGDWDSDDLPRLLEVLAAHVATIVPPRLQWLRRFYTRSFPDSQDNTVERSRHNIHRHYDLSNDLFAAFLDETMTYSSALFAGAAPAWDNLAQAQERKVDRLLDLTGVGPGSRVLEIGTGWGELAVRAAKRGATVHSVTLSAQQMSRAVSYAHEQGVSDRVTVRLCDYRDISGRQEYDAVLSVEMIEAVGEQYWPTYFATLGRLVAPRGRVGLQAITMPHHRMLATRHSYTWIQKYVFPGGLIPSVDVIEKGMRRHAGMSTLERLDFGADYAQTLRLWRERFGDQADRVGALGFDETFQRTWELYLAYSQAGFASGYLNVHQFVFGWPS